MSRRPVGPVPEGPAGGDQLQTRMMLGMEKWSGGCVCVSGGVKTGIIFRGSLRGSKNGAKSLFEGENGGVEATCPWNTGADAGSPNSLP